MKTTLVTILLSVTLSVAAAYAVVQRYRPTQDRLRVRQLELMDKTGRIRGTLEVSESGPELVLKDEDGLTTAAIWSGQKESGLYLETHQGTPPDEPTSIAIGPIAVGDTSPLPETAKAWGIEVRNRGRIMHLGVPNEGTIWMPPSADTLANAPSKP
jgi:hypothetical protein